MSPSVMEYRSNAGVDTHRSHVESPARVGYGYKSHLDANREHASTLPEPWYVCSFLQYNQKVYRSRRQDEAEHTIDCVYC